MRMDEVCIPCTKHYYRQETDTEELTSYGDRSLWLWLHSTWKVTRRLSCKSEVCLSCHAQCEHNTYWVSTGGSGVALVRVGGRGFPLLDEKGQDNNFPFRQEESREELRYSFNQ